MANGGPAVTGRGVSDRHPVRPPPPARGTNGDSDRAAPVLLSGMTHALWSSVDPTRWREALAGYDAAIEAQGVTSLPAHERWYRDTLPGLLTSRTPAHLTDAELVRLTEWKMARGVWRARNLVLVRGNSADAVETASREAFALVPHPGRPVTRLTQLAGVGPATASAVLAAFAPTIYPFFDEVVAAQVPDLGPVAFTAGYYGRYAAALRDRAEALGDGWTPSQVEQALWSHVGGTRGGFGRM